MTHLAMQHKQYTDAATKLALVVQAIIEDPQHSAYDDLAKAKVKSPGLSEAIEGFAGITRAYLGDWTARQG